MSVWKDWRKWGASLFTVGSAECGVCRKPGALHMGICKACRARIPWITDIRCSTCGRPIDCPDCERRKPHYELNRSAVSYSPDMKSWLSLYKYRGDERLAELFADMLLEPYKKLVVELGQGKMPFDLITYVPVSRERLAERGFNQAEQMATGLGRRIKVPVVPLLARVRHTDKQSFKSRAERLEDLRGIFALDTRGAEVIRKLSAKASDRPIRILMIDDVYTTGSTIDECSKLLIESNKVKIYGLTWGR
jgi:competence protein ComFC